MKKLYATVLLAAAMLVVPAQARSHKEKSGPAVIIVIATNPDPAIGTVVAPTLQDAIEQIEGLASLDPVCNIVPQVCAARAANTVYRIFYSNDTEEVVYN